MKLRHIDLDDTTVNPEHQALALPPVEYEVTHAFERPLLRLLSYAVGAILIGLALYLVLPPVLRGSRPEWGDADPGSPA